MNTREIHVTDVTHRTPTRTMVEPDQRHVDILLDRANIPPLDGVVPQPNDYYSLGTPEYSRRSWSQAVSVLAIVLVSVVLVGCAFYGLRALYGAAFL